MQPSLRSAEYSCKLKKKHHKLVKVRFSYPERIIFLGWTTQIQFLELFTSNPMFYFVALCFSLYFVQVVSNHQLDAAKILGLSHKLTLSGEEIKKAYRRKSLNIHPDKSHSSNSNEEFQSLYEARTILLAAVQYGSYQPPIFFVLQNLFDFWRIFLFKTISYTIDGVLQTFFGGIKSIWNGFTKIFV
jgi:hypothetical protein